MLPLASSGIALNSAGSYRAPDNAARDLRVLFSFSRALKLCPSAAATRCL
jgi:hypothetical protein